MTLQAKNKLINVRHDHIYAIEKLQLWELQLKERSFVNFLHCAVRTHQPIDILCYADFRASLFHGTERTKYS